MSLMHLIQIAGALHLGLLIASALTPNVLKWRTELQHLSALSRHVIWVHGAFIMIVILGFGAISVLNARPGGGRRAGAIAVRLHQPVLAGPPDDSALPVRCPALSRQADAEGRLSRPDGRVQLFCCRLWLGRSVATRGIKAMNDRTIVLAGGSGFLGRSMAPALAARGYRIIILTRGTARELPGTTFVHWDGRSRSVAGASRRRRGGHQPRRQERELPVHR